MRTTLDLDDRVLLQAKRRALDRGETLTRFIEHAIRCQLTELSQMPAFRLKLLTKKGQARPDVDWDDRKLAVRAHGGPGLIAVDTNILVYAHREELPKHLVARDRLVALAEGRARWALPAFVLGEFLRIITHRKLFHPPFTPDEACTALSRILASPSLSILHPGPAYVELLMEAIRETQAAGNLIFDAQIVALCREAGVRALLTEDRDFARFPGFVTEALA